MIGEKWVCVLLQPVSFNTKTLSESDVRNNWEGWGHLKAFLMPHGFAYCEMALFG